MIDELTPEEIQALERIGDAMREAAEQLREIMSAASASISDIFATMNGNGDEQ